MRGVELHMLFNNSLFFQWNNAGIPLVFPGNISLKSIS